MDNINIDPIDEMSTESWMRELQAKDLREDAVLAGEDETGQVRICPKCYKPTYITAKSNGTDDFDIVEFCVTHKEL